MRDVLLDFIRHWFRDNPFRKEETNEKDVDYFLSVRPQYDDYKHNSLEDFRKWSEKHTTTALKNGIDLAIENYKKQI